MPSMTAAPPASPSARYDLRRASVWKRYGFFWVTGALFVVSLAGHWWLGWSAYAADQRQQGAEPTTRGYLVVTGRDTLENWQSEFLQLIWQVAGLSLLFHVGSPQSREEDDRIEGKIEAILRAVSPGDADRIIAELDGRFDRA